MPRSRYFRPRLEVLEDRCVPSTFTVTNLRDDGSAGSLRQRIDAANAHPGADSVVFKPGLEGTILLGGSGEIDITDSLTLTGPGAALVAVDGNATSRIFNIIAPASIQGLELRNGKGDFGGAISTNDNLTLTQDVLDDNLATKGGGAVFASANLTIKKCTITGNTASGTPVGGGGAVDFDGGAFTLTGSTISGNTAAAQAGGLALFMGTTATITNSVISGNHAGTYGGGLYAGEVFSLTITNSTISGNRSDGQGGGLFTQAGTTSVTSSQITFNTAVSSGGGLVSHGVLTVDGCTVSGNTTGQRGGGIRQAEGFLVLTDSTVSGNHADQSQGGGVCIVGATDLSTVRGCTITGNSAGAGGGVFSQSNPLAITRSVLSGNTALTGDGGGVAQTGSYLLMNGCTVSGNYADDHGGGISLDTTAASAITGSTISGNTAFQGGGVSIRTAAGSLTLSDSTISGNQAQSSGGGVYENSSALIVQNSTIAFNRAIGLGSVMGILGGGFSCFRGSLDLTSTIVAQNSAKEGHPDLDSTNTAISAAFCLIGSIDGADNFTADSTTLGLLGLDPLLAPLAFNGGPTQTHALKKGSPAINHGSNPGGLTSDQRGAPFARQLGPAVDIGAYERQ